MVLFDWYFCLAILFHDNSSSVKVERSTDVAIDVLSDVDYMYIYSDFIHRRSLSNLNLLMTSDDKVLIYVYPLHYKINVLRLTTVRHFESRLGSFSNLLKKIGALGLSGTVHQHTRLWNQLIIFDSENLVVKIDFS